MIRQYKKMLKPIKFEIILKQLTFNELDVSESLLVAKDKKTFEKTYSEFTKITEKSLPMVMLDEPVIRGGKRSFRINLQYGVTYFIGLMKNSE